MKPVSQRKPGPDLLSAVEGKERSKERKEERK